MRSIGLCVLLFAASSVGGCSSKGNRVGAGHGTSPGEGGVAESFESLRLEPADAVLHVVDGTAAVQPYRAIGVLPGGQERDVTDRVTFALSNAAVGEFASARFISSTIQGGRTAVTATLDGVTGSTGLTVVFERHESIPPTRGAPPLPADPASLFGAATDPSRAPELVYPNDGVVLPPNLGRIEIHWLRGPDTNTLFEVAFTNDVTDVHYYVRCERPRGVRADGCIWEPSGPEWSYIAQTNRGASPVTVQVRATDDTGSSVGESATRQLRFSLDDLMGTIYYWTTSDGGRIQRYDFGAAAGMAMTAVGPSDGSCVGCHSLSRDGRKLAASIGGQHNGGLLLLDLASSTVLRRTPAAAHVLQFSTFSPDGNQLAGVYGDDGTGTDFGDLLLFDTRCDASSMATCGMQVGRISLGGEEASHPAWSPDGDHIAFTNVGLHRTSQRPGYGAVAMVDRMPDGTWSAPHDIVPRADGKSRYNPNWAPDGSFLVFDESTCPGGDTSSVDCDADTDPSAHMWAVTPDGGTPIDLANAAAPGTMDDGATDLANTFPRFAPFVFALTGGDLGGRRLMWLTFSSTRSYGLRTQNPSSVGDENAKSTWLWMTAIDPDAVTAGRDPSFPAFCLPFQDLATSNHIAVWTEASVGGPVLY